jgi:hypothetical protein
MDYTDQQGMEEKPKEMERKAQQGMKTKSKAFSQNAEFAVSRPYRPRGAVSIRQSGLSRM